MRASSRRSKSSVISVRRMAVWVCSGPRRVSSRGRFCGLLLRIVGVLGEVNDVVAAVVLAEEESRRECC